MCSHEGASLAQGTPFDARATLSYAKGMSLSKQKSLLPNAAREPWCIGIDEAGRGCLAGPVVAAAVLLPEHVVIEGLDDSKKLSAARRDALAQEIYLHAKVGIGVIWQGQIDKINILQATFHAMSKALRGLCKGHHIPQKPHVYIDGNKVIPPQVLQEYWQNMPYGLPVQEFLIGGDGLMPAIGAASIVAKTQRDRIMQLLHRRHTVYNFAGHKGYGTKEHVAAIEAHGPCSLHRMTFAPLSTLFGEQQREKTPSKRVRQGSLL